MTRNRLPKLFACLHEGTVDAWRVRKVARATRKFTIAQASDADRRLSHPGVDGVPLIARIGMTRSQRILDQIRIVEDPDDAEDERTEARNRRSVSIWPEQGVARINGTLSIEDGQRLDRRLDQIVESHRFLGDTRSYDVLRSVALGMLAQAARAGPGVWLWLSPDGRSYLVTGGTTTKLPGRVTT
ncbi:MAG: DUF222 domain-containing protein, partial [Actinomycetes bacterium]